MRPRAPIHVTAAVNRHAFFVCYKSDEGYRTYACADRDGLEACVYHLTGRLLYTFLLDERGLPYSNRLTVSGGHIYSSPSPGRAEVIKPKTGTEEARYDN